jgi:hypothetical protein
MANTSVILINNGGIYVPSVPSVPVAAGSTVSFATSDGSAVTLYFSPAAASALSPAPGAVFSLAAKGSAVFTFTSSAPGAYSVAFNAPGQSFPSSVSPNLNLLVDPGAGTGPGFGGPHDVVNPGS